MRQVDKLGDMITLAAYDEVPAVFQVNSLRLRIKVDPCCDAIPSAPSDLTHLLDDPAYSWNFECCAHHNHCVWNFPYVSLGHAADSVLIRVVLVIEDDSGA
jgi:hypothetical protein